MEVCHESQYSYTCSDNYFMSKFILLIGPKSVNNDREMHFMPTQHNTTIASFYCSTRFPEDGQLV